MSRKQLYGKAYDLEGPDDARELYGAWAADYDVEMVEDHGYRAPEMLASLVDERIGDKTSWIVDVGCGTGLVGYHLGRRGFRHVDGVDLVQEMLDQAAAKDCYTRLVRGNLLERIPINENRYDVAVSAGTFTHRHVGPDGLDEVVRVVRPGGKALILCNGEAYAADGYEAKIEDLKRLGLVDVTESSDVGTILDNGIRGQLLVLDIHI